MRIGYQSKAKVHQFVARHTQRNQRATKGSKWRVERLRNAVFKTVFKNAVTVGRKRGRKPLARNMHSTAAALVLTEVYSLFLELSCLSVEAEYTLRAADSPELQCPNGGGREQRGEKEVVSRTDDRDLVSFFVHLSRCSPS